MTQDIAVVEPRYADLQRVRSLIGDSEFDAVLAAWPENVGYLAGFYHPDMWVNWERLHLVIWPSAGSPAFIVPRVRADNWNVAGTPSFAPEPSRPLIADIRGYDGEHLDMVRVAAEVLRELGVTRGVLGIEGRTLPEKMVRELGRLLPGLVFRDAWPVLNSIRQVKTAAEVETITRANILTAEVLERVLRSVRAGETERHVAARLVKELWAEGGHEISHSVLGGGVRAGEWHPWPSDQVLEEGMLLRTDFGVRIDGYHSDIARNAVVGRASAHQRDMFSRISEVHDIVVDALKPGVMPSELVSLAQRNYARLGLDYRWGLVGHGVGLVIHEEPQLHPDYTQPLVAGMTLEIELGWVDQHEGYHIEDLVHLGLGGAVNLTRRDRERRRLIETELS